MSSSGLPANPFIAKIAGGKCKCVPPRRSAMCKCRGSPAKAGHKGAAGSRSREAPTAARGAVVFRRVYCLKAPKKKDSASRVS
jgi:hypothetical protein